MITMDITILNNTMNKISPEIERGGNNNGDWFDNVCRNNARCRNR